FHTPAMSLLLHRLGHREARALRTGPIIGIARPACGPGPEQGGSDAHHRSAFLHRNLVINGHTHGQIPKLRPGPSEPVPKLPEPRERGSRTLRVARESRKRHQAHKSYAHERARPRD